MDRVPIVDAEADALFRKAAQRAGLNPDNPWVSGYVDYQWNHSRYVFQSLPEPIGGQNVLEFGCNFGASSVVLALLGAKVTAVDVNPAYLEVARLNARRYGVADAIQFHCVSDTSRMPFTDESFDVVTCISVLEYVPSPILDAVQREIDRVLRIGGVIAVSGTSNRLWPREVHSRRWFVQYLPESWFKSSTIVRGVTPWRVRYGFGAHYTSVDRNDRGLAYLRARVAMGGGKLRNIVYRGLNMVAQALGVSTGLCMPNMAVTLRKLAK